MKRLLLCSLAAGLSLALSAQPAAADTKVAKAMGDLRWGMTDDEVVSFLVRKVKEEYIAKMKKAKGAKKASLKRKAKTIIRDIKDSLTEFDGGRTRWDSSDVADEFTHGNYESLVAYDDGSSKNYYFFFEGRLWKWYKAYPNRAFGGRNFKKFSRNIKKRFGKGYVKDGELNAGSGKSHKWLEYRDRSTRLRAVDDTGHSGDYALIFEEISTMQSLASMRGNSRKSKSKSRLASVSSPSRKATKKAKSSRSIFDSNDGRGETAAEYKARKKKVLAEARAKQRRIHERSRDKKQGKVLDSMAGLDDSDPISGM